MSIAYRTPNDNKTEKRMRKPVGDGGGVESPGAVVNDFWRVRLHTHTGHTCRTSREQRVKRVDGVADKSMGNAVSTYVRAAC